MSSFEWVSLGTVCDFENGDRGENYPSKSEFQKQGIPFLNAGNIADGSLTAADFDCITQEKYDSLRAGKVRYGDILFCLRGAIGKCAVSTLDKAAIASSLVIIRNKPCIDARYLYYVLTSAYFQKCMSNCDNGSVQGNMSVAFLKTINIPLPSFAAQEIIARVLGAIDDKIALNKKMMTELEYTARLIYDYWFTQFDFPDENGKPYRSSGGKMVYNETLNREIPEGWEVTKIGKQCELRLGGTPDTSVREFWGGGMPWLNSAEVAVSPILRAEKNITKAGVENSATSFAPAGSVLLSITRYIRPSILAIDACFNQSVVAILENRTLHTEFLYPFVQSQVPRYLTLRTGAQQPHINKVTVSETCFSMPTELILARYYDKVAPIFNQLILVAKAVDRLSALRDWLLPMLVNGQVHVD